MSHTLRTIVKALEAERVRFVPENPLGWIVKFDNMGDQEYVITQWKKFQPFGVDKYTFESCGVIYVTPADNPHMTFVRPGS